MLEKSDFSLTFSAWTFACCLMRYQVLFYLSGARDKTALRVRCRDVQGHFGKNCGAKKCGGRYEKVR